MFALLALHQMHNVVWKLIGFIQGLITKIMDWRKRLKQDIENKHLSIGHFCRGTTFSKQHIQSIIKGKIILTFIMAVKLEEYQIGTARFWMMAQLEDDLKNANLS